MNDALQLAAAALRHLWLSWRSLRAVELAVAALLALCLLAERLGVWMDFGLREQSAASFALQVLLLLAQAGLVLLCWLPAARGEALHPWRGRRLALAVLLGSIACAALLRSPLPQALADAWGTPLCDVCGRPVPGGKSWLESLGEALIVVALAGLAAAATELLARRRHHADLLQSVLDEQARLAQEASRTRLAARAARVDPQALFDTLSAVEAQLADPEAAAQAAAELERLMMSLRQALKRPMRPLPTEVP